MGKNCLFQIQNPATIDGVGKKGHMDVGLTILRQEVLSND
jgi:hypothetical protein